MLVMFVFNNNMLNDDELIDLFEEVEKKNDQNPLTFFEALTACYFYKAAEYPNNINLIEAGLFPVSYTHLTLPTKRIV